jgi:outer membrane protein assembly factor BamE
MKKLLLIGAMAATMSLCGCVYHPPIYQGNVLTPEKMQSIQPGMTSEQVVAKLGNPVLKNVYAQNRMTYIYTSQPTKAKMEIKKLQIDFRNNRVSNVRTWL